MSSSPSPPPTTARPTTATTAPASSHQPTLVPLDQDVSTGVIKASLSNTGALYVASYDFTFNQTTLSPTLYASIVIWLSEPITSAQLMQVPGTPPVQAILVLPSSSGGGTQSTCTLCSVLAKDTAQGVPTACLPTARRVCLHSAAVPASASMRVEAKIAGFPFHAEFRLRSTPAANDDWAPLSEAPSPAPSFTRFQEADRPLSLNDTSISVWFFVVISFVFLCAWRVYRQHRINTLLAGAGRRAGGSEEVVCPPGLVLRVREVALSPVHVSATASGANEPYPMYPSAEAVVVGAAGGEGHGDADPVLTVQAVAAEGSGQAQQRRL